MSWNFTKSSQNYLLGPQVLFCDDAIIYDSEWSYTRQDKIFQYLTASGSCMNQANFTTF